MRALAPWEVVVLERSLLLFIHTSADVSLLEHPKFPLSLARMHKSSNSDND